MLGKKVTITFAPKMDESVLQGSISKLKTAFKTINFSHLTKDNKALANVTKSFTALENKTKSIFKRFAGKSLNPKQMKELKKEMAILLEQRIALKKAITAAAKADQAAFLQANPRAKQQIKNIRERIAELKAEKKEKLEPSQTNLATLRAQIDPAKAGKYAKTLLKYKQLITAEEAKQKKYKPTSAEYAAHEATIQTLKAERAERERINDEIKQEVAARNAIAAKYDKKIETKKVDLSAKLNAGKSKAEVDAMNNALKQTQTTLTGVKTEADKLGAEVDNAGKEMKDLQVASDKAKDTMQSMGLSLQNLAQVFGVVTVMRKLWREARKAYDTIKQLDEKLTEIATVTGQTRDQMWGMFSTFNTLAKQLGVTTSEVVDASIIFYRQGLKTAQVMDMVRASTISAAIANITTSEASDRLTSALNGFQLAAGEAMGVADKFAALAAKSASSFDELSYALSKTAASAQVAGIDMDHMLGFIAKVVETTREAPENIGTAFKTIIARMQQLQDVGRTLDDGISLNKTEKALRTVGVTLRNKVTGQFRDLDEVFNDLGDKWDDLDRNTKAYMATILSGSRQQSRFLALMNDYSRTTELVGIAQNSAGEASTQFATHLTGVEAALNRLKTAGEKVYQEALNADAIIAVVGAFASIVEVVAELNPLLVITLGLMAALTFSTSAKVAATTADTISTMGAAGATEFYNKVATQSSGILPKLAAWISKKTLGHYAEALGINSATAAAVAYLAVLTAMIALIGVAIYLIVRASKARERHVKALQETVNAAKEDLSTLQRQEDRMKSLIETYEELSKVQNKNKQEQEELAKTTEELSELFPHLILGYDNLGNAIIDYKIAREELLAVYEETIQKAKELLAAELALQQTKIGDNFDQGNLYVGATNAEEVAEVTRNNDELTASIIRQMSEYQVLQDFRGGYDSEGAVMSSDDLYEIQKLGERQIAAKQLAAKGMSELFGMDADEAESMVATWAKAIAEDGKTVIGLINEFGLAQALSFQQQLTKLKFEIESNAFGMFNQYIEQTQGSSFGQLTADSQAAIKTLGVNFLGDMGAVLAQGMLNNNIADDAQQIIYAQFTDGFDEVYKGLEQYFLSNPEAGTLVVDAFNIDEGTTLNALKENFTNVESIVTDLTADMTRNLQSAVSDNDLGRGTFLHSFFQDKGDVESFLNEYGDTLQSGLTRNLQRVKQELNSVVGILYGEDDIEANAEALGDLTFGSLQQLGESIDAIPAEKLEGVKENIAELFNTNKEQGVTFLEQLLGSESDMDSAIDTYSEMINSMNELSVQEKLDLTDVFFYNNTTSLEDLSQSVEDTVSSLKTLNDLQSSAADANASSVQTILALESAQLRYTSSINGTTVALSTASELAFLSNEDTLQGLKSSIKLMEGKAKWLDDERDRLADINDGSAEHNDELDEITSEWEDINREVQLYYKLINNIASADPLKAGKDSVADFLSSTGKSLRDAYEDFQEMEEMASNGAVSFEIGKAFIDANEKFGYLLQQTDTGYDIMLGDAKSFKDEVAEIWTQMVEAQISSIEAYVAAHGELSEDAVRMYDTQILGLQAALINNETIIADVYKSSAEAADEYEMQLTKLYNIRGKLNLLETKNNINEQRLELAKSADERESITRDMMANYEAIAAAREEEAQEILNQMVTKAKALDGYSKYVKKEGELIEVQIEALKGAGAATQEFVETQVQAYNDLVSELNDVISQLYSDIQALEDLKDQALASQNSLEDLIVSALIARDAAALEDYVDAINKVNEALEREKDILVEINEERKKAKEDLEKEKTLQDKIARYNLISRDNSGMYLKEKLDLEEEIAELRDEILEDSIQAQIDAQVAAIDGEIDQNDQSIQNAQDAHDAKVEDMQEYWAEVEKLINGEWGAIEELLTNWNDDYKRSNKRRRQEYLESWQGMFNDTKLNVGYINAEIQRIQDEIQALTNKLRDTEQAAKDASAAIANIGKGNTSGITPFTPSGATATGVEDPADRVEKDGVAPIDPNDPTLTDGDGSGAVAPVINDVADKNETNPDQILGGEDVFTSTSGQGYTLAGIKTNAATTLMEAGVPTNSSAYSEIAGAYDAATVNDVLDRYLPSFDAGGAVTFTGPAMLHGSPSEPEQVFNFDQLKDIASMMQAAKSFVSEQTEYDSQGAPMIIQNEIIIQVDDSVDEDNAEEVGEKIGQGIENFFKKIQESNPNALSMLKSI